MAYNLKQKLQKIFLEHWLKKIIALFLAIIIWFWVHRSITTNQDFSVERETSIAKKIFFLLR